MKTEKLKEIIRSVPSMSTCPEYFSGRGATLTDLNSEILEKIYQGIEKEFGEKAASNYVKMVDGIKVLSATTFLQELYLLESRGWEYVPKRDESGIVVPKNEDGEYNTELGMLGMISALSSSGRDDTQQIKGHFLLTHGIKPKEKFGNENGYLVRYY